MGSMPLEAGQAPWYLYQVPVLNTILLTKDLLAQKASPENMLISLAVTGPVALLGCVLASRLFRKESILFRV